ncbi:cytochrome P450 [Mycobacteroides salmoniphilum]|uniref:Cytochrome P450 120 n=2 Tax=Mycobacteroides salmoniphilum TaxID=404941 RepID=A0A4R8SD21_9MYCO|nr:cytochrome P450 [Mycobacteroides salmoniphilum]TDZ93223.1 putative cytochrome P450 120 [Mycobacteroides salmoniphilum]TEA07814.1 putative cytochrome P450 120 [Mycobacteroides salmoniphilum]
MSMALRKRVRDGAAWLTERAPSSIRPLAEPPAGSGLKPILGDQGVPLVGHGLEFLADTVDFARRRYSEFGPVSWSGSLGVCGVWVMGPEAAAEVLTNRDKAFANGPGWGHFIGPFFRRGIMLLDGEEHLQHRRIMQQAFTRGRLETYLGIFNDGVTEGISGWKPTQQFLLYDAIKKLLLDGASELFVGQPLDDESDQLNTAFIDTVAAVTAVVRADVPGGAWHRGLKGRQVLEHYFRDRLSMKRQGTGDDLFSVMCRAESEDGATFSDDDIVNHMIFLLMAAHDTSTITASTMAYYLAKYPRWQEQLRAEAQSLGKPMLDYEYLDRLPLLDQAFKETLRLNPPVGNMVRRTVKDTSISGHYVPTDTYVFVLPTATHRLAEIWSKPDTFDPDRFAEHRREDKAHRYAWQPFGGGAHKCIGMFFGGMQVKALLYQLLLNYSWSVTETYEPPLVYGTGLYPEDGLPVALTSINSSPLT